MLSHSVPSWLKARQEEAARLAVVAGWPQKRDETWRYTSLRELEGLQFSDITAGPNEFQLPPDITPLVAGADNILFFYNGEFLKAVSSAQAQEELIVSPLSKVLLSADRVQERAKVMLELKPNENLRNIGLSNAANFKQGAFVEITSSKVKKIKIANVHLYGNQVNASEQRAFVVYPKNIYSFGENVEADVVELHIAVNSIQFQTSSSSEIRLAQGAKVNMAQVLWLGDEAFGFSDVNAKLSKDAALQFFGLTIDGKLIRNEIQILLAEEGAELSLLNLSLANENSHIDNSSCVIHQKGHTKSEQIVRCVLGESSKSVFSGRLRIEQDAQKSNASQYCHNLLMSETAEADARPQLEVFADDVKAAHGTTIGQLSREQLFYLQSRAIDKDKATQMLATAFQQEIINKTRSAYIGSVIKKCAGSKN